VKSIALWPLAACLMSLLMPSAGARGQTDQKLNLSIFYAGHPGSAREADFLQFLNSHFTHVDSGDLAKFDGSQAAKGDVVLLDYDGEAIDVMQHGPRPALPGNYSRPTVTIGVVGGLICNQLRLKTGYM
jgi:hypothetical protein